MFIIYGQAFGAEFVGTMLLVLLGNSVVYNIIGKKTFGANGGWLMGSFAWAMAVLIGVLVSTAIYSKSGSLNPAVTVAFWIQPNSGMDAPMAFVYFAAEIAGAAVGQVVANLINNKVAKEIKTASFGAHANSPSHQKALGTSFGVEFVATGVLIVAAVYALGRFGDAVPKGLGPVIVGAVILSIALSLGGLTGYAINPARDTVPRIVYMAFHKVMKFEGSPIKVADWKYGWIPLVAPLAAGGVVGGFLAIPA